MHTKTRRRGSITKQTNGKFLARVRLPANATNGKRPGPSRSFLLETDAQAWLDEQFARLDQGLPIGDAISLERALREVLRSTRSSFSSDTGQRYLELLESYVFRLNPGLCGKPLRDITLSDIHQIFATLRSTHPHLSVHTVARVRRVLQARLSDCVRANFINRHPMGTEITSDHEFTIAELRNRIDELETAISERDRRIAAWDQRA